MRRLLVCSLCLALTLPALPGRSQDNKDPYAQHIASTPPRTPAEEQKAFHVPPGFEVQLVAAEPDIRKPINMNFDAHGRLWLTDSVEYPFPAKDPSKARDTVKILDDFGEDGRARKITTFAGGLNIPIGVMPLTPDPSPPRGEGSKGMEALVYSIPDIWRLRDTRGTGQADSREILYEKYGFNDTHGMTNSFTWGFDGWIYATHGFSNTSTIKAHDGSAITVQSGNTYRIRPDGAHVEQITWGQVNPFGLCFDPLGNLYSADCHTQPIYQLLRGAYYPSFGKPHDGLGFGPETISRYDDSTAIAGIVYYAADHFPKEYQGSAYIGDVVTHKINQFTLAWHGSSSRATQHAFLSSDDPWYRPVDIKLGPDGALYVADFYNRIIGHYEVPLTHPGRDRERGRVWRIVYRGADGKGKATAPRKDWTTGTVPELIGDLSHPNLTVRMLATNQLAERAGDDVTQAVRDAVSADRPWTVRAHGLWVLQRRGALDEQTLAQVAKDGRAPVRVHVMRILAERAKLPAKERDLVLAGLKDEDPFVRRCAAEALGRHPAPENVRPLLDLRHDVPEEDTHLLHVVRMALRDQFRPEKAWEQVPRSSWTEADARAVADVAAGTPNLGSAQFLLQHLRAVQENRDNQVRYAHHTARYGSAETDEQLLGFLRDKHGGDVPLQAALLRAMSQGLQERGAKGSDGFRAFAGELTGKLLASRDGGQVKSGIELANLLKLTAAQDSIAALALDRGRPEGERTEALKTLVGIDPGKQVGLLGRLVGDAAEPLSLREQAAKLLAQVNQPAAHEQLVKALASVPARLQVAIAVEMAAGKAGAEKLLDAVAAGKASARLLQERVVAVRLQASKVPDLDKRLAKLTAGLPAADQKLEKLLEARRNGFGKARPDARKGALVFEKSCAVCHQVGGKGAKYAPQLDGIGLRGLDRLLEDVLDPNRNVDQAFRQTNLTLKSGQVVYGLLFKEEGAVLVLVDGQGKEVRVAKDNVEERSTSQVSPMPGNFADQIPEEDFYNLLAFLLAQKAPPDKK
jgi:putative heme-binding domain-containing protein